MGARAVTVYVDDVMIKATVGSISDRWCHLFSFDPDPTELHELAKRIGLRRVWFQDKDRTGRSPWRNHYDVTRSRRKAAIRSGAVPITFREFAERLHEIRSKSMTFQQVLNGYVECALFASNAPGDDRSFRKRGFTRGSIVPETLAGMRSDVERFLREAPKIIGDTEVEPSQIGHDFWLTRNHHGTGFWAGDYLPEPQLKELTELAHTFGEYSLDLNDFGELYGFRS
jgi:hypothetical protein